jgi:chitodextrinase
MSKKILHSFLLFVLLGIGAVVLPKISKAAAFTFSPASGSATVNNTFTVNIVLDTQSADIYGAEINLLRFNPSLLQVVDSDGATAGVQVSAGSLMSFTTVNAVNNSAGTIQFSQLASPGSTYRGSGTFATITFRAVAAGTAAVSIDFTLNSTTDSNIAGLGSDLLTSVGSANFTLSPADTTAPVISSVAVSGITQSVATVTWNTNEASDSQVEYGLTTSYGTSSTLDSAQATFHSVTLSGLSAATTYNFRVKSRDAAGNLALGSNQTFTTLAAPDTTAPTAPSSLTASSVTTTRVDLAWTASTDAVGVTGYRVERCSGSTSCSNFSQIGTSAAASYFDTPLTASTAYRYRVRANDAAGNLSAYSNIVTVTTPAPVNQAPTGSLDGVNGLNQVFGWSQDPDNTSVANIVHLYFDKNAGTAGAVAVPVTASDFRSDVGNHAFNYNIPDSLKDGLTHQVWAWGIDLTNPASNNSQLAGSPKTFNIAPPATAPVITAFTATPSGITSGQSSTLAWTVTGTPTPSLSLNQGIGTVTGSSRSVSPTVTTTYILTATNSAGSVTQSVTVTVSPAPDTTAPSVPTATFATSTALGQITVTWNVSTDTGGSGLAGYKIFRCTGTGCTPNLQVGTSAVTTFNNTGLAKNTTYTYAVSAYDGAGNSSSLSGSASATTQAVRRKIRIRLESVSSNNTTSGKLAILDGQNVVLSEVSFTTDSTGEAQVEIPDSMPATASLRVTANGFLPRKVNAVNLSDLSLLEVTIPQLLGGEFNSDSLINSLDFSIMNGKWQTSDNLTDLNKDGQVNSLDFAFLSKNWLQPGE